MSFVVVVVIFSSCFWLTDCCFSPFFNRLDENLRFAESTVGLVVDKFCRDIIDLFGPTYLRPPNEQDMKNILAGYERKGWIGCMGCVDVMKWVWKNCPMAWRGQYQGRETHPTIALEAIVDSR